MTPGSLMSRSRRVRSTASSRSAPLTTATTLSEPDVLAASVSNSMTARVYLSSRNTAQVMMHPILLFHRSGGLKATLSLNDAWRDDDIHGSKRGFADRRDTLDPGKLNAEDRL